MIQPLSALHSWAIHAEQGQYHVSSSSGEVVTRKGFASRFLPVYQGNPKHGKAESRGGKVALIRGVWVYDG